MSSRNFEAVVMDTVYGVIHVEYMFIAHILVYILHKYWMCNSISPFYDVASYVTVYNMSFNTNCRILAVELNYRFTDNFKMFFKFLGKSVLVQMLSF